MDRAQGYEPCNGGSNPSGVTIHFRSEAPDARRGSNYPQERDDAMREQATAPPARPLSHLCIQLTLPPSPRIRLAKTLEYHGASSW